MDFLVRFVVKKPVLMTISAERRLFFTATGAANRPPIYKAGIQSRKFFSTKKSTTTDNLCREITRFFQ